MALDGILNSQTISKITNVNYDVAADAKNVANKVSLSNTTLCPAIGVEANSLLKDVTSNINTGANKLMGIVSDITPKINIPFKDKINQFKDAIARGEASTLANLKGCGINTESPQSALNSIMNKKALLTAAEAGLSVAGLKGLTTQLTSLENINISNLIGGDTKNLLQQALGKGSISSSQLESIGKGLINSLGATGSTAKTKLQTQSFLTGITALVNGPTSVSSKITSLTNASVIDTLVGTNPALASKYIQTTLNNANGSNPNITVNGVVDSMTTALKKPTDSTTETKLLLMSSINSSIAANNPAQAQLMTVATKGMSGPVISNLASVNNNRTSTSPVSDFTNITSGLSSMDTNWNVDSLNQVNYSVVASNPRISTLATNVATTAHSKSFLDGSATTDLSDYTTINVINSCKDTAIA